MGEYADLYIDNMLEGRYGLHNRNFRKRKIRKLANSETHYIRGVANWAKIIGPPRTNNFDESVKEWTIDVTPDDEGVKLLKKLGLADRIKDKGQVQFRQREKRADGTLNDPIRVADENGDPWDDRLIGNGSEVDVKFAVKNYGKGKRKGVYIRAVRVRNLVPYEHRDFAPIEKDEDFFADEPEEPKQEKFTNSKFKKDFLNKDDDLDDDIAF